MTSSSSISGIAPALAREHRALGEQQGQQSEPLLALGAVHAQLAAVAEDRQLVAVRAVAGEAALEVAREALPQLGDELLHVVRARARAVLERGRPAAARAAQLAPQKGAASSATASARWPAELEGLAASSRSQVAERRLRGAPGADAAQQRVALCEHPRVLAPCLARERARARRRPDRGARGGAPVVL